MVHCVLVSVLLLSNQIEKSFDELLEEFDKTARATERRNNFSTANDLNVIIINYYKCCLSTNRFLIFFNKSSNCQWNNESCCPIARQQAGQQQHAYQQRHNELVHPLGCKNVT